MKILYSLILYLFFFTPIATANPAMMLLVGGSTAAAGGDTIDYRSSSTSSSYQGGTPREIAVTKPSGTVDGDMLIAIIADDATDGTAWASTGWTIVSDTDNQHNCTVLYKEASSEGASWTFSSTGTASDISVVVAAYSKTGGSWDTTDMTTNDTTNTGLAASITTSSTTCPASSILVAGYTNDSGYTVSTPPASMTTAGGITGTSTAAYGYYESVGSGSYTRTLVWSSGDGTVAPSLCLSLQ